MKIFSILLLFSILLSSCSEYLDAKPDKSLVVPSELEDLQGLLDNTNVMNNSGSLGLLASDDIFTVDAGYLAFSSEWMRRGYIWQDDLFIGENFVSDWIRPYQQIFYSNVVLESLDKNPESNSPTFNQVQGSAYFYRAYAYFGLCQVFAPAYLENGSGALPGVPIKPDSNVNDHQALAELAKNYQLIIDDLNRSLELLPDKADYSTRPSKQAAHAMLSRVYLSIGNYGQAEFHAEASLSIGNDLVDFEEILSTNSFPMASARHLIPRMNKEIVFFDQLVSDSYLSNANFFADTTVINSYKEGDIRRLVFFYLNPSTGGNNFVGHFTGNFRYFNGITVSEVLLNKAECLARKGDGEGAIATLEILRSSRFEESKYSPLAWEDGNVLDVVLEERRRELICRGYLRWMDLKRLSFDPNYSKEIIRVIEGRNYRLDTKNSPMHFPIPQMETDLNDHINP
ncbi:RagB/SusD family nutrient uptake outer membrane protein [Algoriphagus sp. Y33]|uniref:RagB/SusD family nutrient uptake outer membrane protein n=1 Tax=Algoriphagus sp. Y33 TaxID=2772483 RepID=UPI001783467E|nr:RagB/SusD family nutrient uptake outer membrane protein [Algoriphagus sp. Y33]